MFQRADASLGQGEMLSLRKFRRTSSPLIFCSFFLVTVAGSEEVCFSPDGGIWDQLIRRINSSQSGVDIAVYSFTSGEIAVNAEKYSHEDALFFDDPKLILGFEQEFERLWASR